MAVSLAHEEALVDFDESKVDETALRDVLRDVGYTIRDPEQEHAETQEVEGEEELAERVAAAGFEVE